MKWFIFIFLCLTYLRGLKGYTRISRILGGTVEQKGKYPFIVSLQESNIHFCGGTIYSKQFILTAAHCFNEERLNGDRFFYLSALVGVTDLNDKSGIRHAINTVIQHEQYDPEKVVNDIALVKLETEIHLNNFAKLVNIEKSFVGPDVLANVLGWGLTSVNGTGSNLLLSLTVKTTSVDICNTYYKNPIDDTQICIDPDEGKDVCGGDSGGPVLIKGKQAGILSFVSECGKGNPEVALRISAYSKWIVKHISSQRCI